MPYSAVTVGGIALLCFPPEDRLFAARARACHELLALEGTVTPRDLQGALRPVFPYVVVRPRERLASFGGDAWYAYRDGRYSPFQRGEPWWDQPSAARLVVGDDGRYHGANAAAHELLRVTHEALAEARSGDFTSPAYRALVPWVLQLLRDTGELHSVSVARPADGSPDIPVEFRFVRDADGPGRHVAWMRRIPTEAVEPVVAPPGSTEARETQAGA